MPSNLKSKAVTGIIWTLFDKVFSQVLSFVVIIILARELTPQDFGLVGMLAIFVLVAESLINSGFSQALIQKQDRSELDFSTVFCINLALALVLYLMLFVSSPIIASFYNSPLLEELSQYLFLVLIFNALCIVPRTKLNIALNFKLLAKVNFTSLIISSGVAIYAAINGCGVWSLVYQQLARSFATMLLLYFLNYWRPSLVFSQVSFKNLFGFGSKLLIAGVLATIVNNLYALLIGRYFGAKDVGYYMQGQKISSILAGTVNSALQGVTFPVMTSVQHDRARLLDIYKRVVEMTAFVVFPVMIGFTFIAEPFVHLFLTEKWLPAVPIIQWLCLAAMLVPLNALHLNILNVIGRSDLFLKTDIIKLPINLVALYIALPYGIEGVVVGQFITRILAFIINSYYPGQLLGYGLWPQVKDLLPIIAISVGLALVLSLVNIDDHFLGMISTMIIGFLAYFIMALTIKVSAMSEIVNLVKSKLVRQN